MRILFCIYKPSRKMEHSYNNYLNEAGFSGTDAQVLEMVHFLQKAGHECKMVYETDLLSVWGQHWDIFCPEFYLNNQAIVIYMAALPKTTKILLYLQSFIDIDGEIKEFLEERPSQIVGVSEFVEKYYKDLGFPYKTIYNAINPDIFTNNELSYEKKRGNFVFFASFERGGIMALSIFKNLNIPNKKMYICAYDLHDFNLIQTLSKDKDIVFLESLSKRKVKELLDNCDYFIYPLVNHKTKNIHHDTFGCVILESMACGVSVITWDVACNSHVYKDYAELIPPILTNDYDPQAKFGRNKDFLSKTAVDLFVDKINYMENNPEYKKKRKDAAREWALTHTWENKTNELIEFINI